MSDLSVALHSYVLQTISREGTHSIFLLFSDAKLVFSTTAATLVVEQHPRGHVVPLFQEIKVHVVLAELGRGICTLLPSF